MKTEATLFVRRSALQDGEYNKNFLMHDRDAVTVVTSAEARKITPMMGTLYLSLTSAPLEHWERKGVLHFTGDEEGGRPLTAWQQLVRLLGCGNSTAKKALDWMRKCGVIGYSAGKNGVGIRIFINRAASSIGRRDRQKNLHVVPTPVKSRHTPTAGAPFNADGLEVQDTDYEIRAPESGANRNRETKHNHYPEPLNSRQVAGTAGMKSYSPAALTHSSYPIREVVAQLRSELQSGMELAAAEAASKQVAKEVGRTREWFEERALPKAVRIAQKESYNVLRSYGLINKTKPVFDIGRNQTLSVASQPTPQVTSGSTPRPKTDEEIRDLAESCIALFESQGKSLEATLSELGSKGTSWLAEADLGRIAEAAHGLLQDQRRKQ